MELDTFITETLRQIIKGVQIAQKHEDCKEARINPDTIKNKPARSTTFVGERIQNIEFDVAVTIEEATGKKAGIGIFTGALGIGGQADSNAASSSVSRIKFSVPVILPTE